MGITEKFLEAKFPTKAVKILGDFSNYFETLNVSSLLWLPAYLPLRLRHELFGQLIPQSGHTGSNPVDGKDISYHTKS